MSHRAARRRWTDVGLALLVSFLVLATGVPAPPDAGAQTPPPPSPPPTTAATGGRLADPQVLIVLDLSSSMSDLDANGIPKIDGARNALADFVPALPGDARVGLWTYPEPSSGDTTAACATGGPVIGGGGMSRIDPQAVTSTIYALDADGDNTPTGPALEAAASMFQGAGDRTIVLVSDGEHNCGVDPCEVARNLAGQGIDISINTVGFQISDAGEQSLQCIADAANGEYTDVESGQDLIEALPDLSRATLSVSVSAPDTIDPAIGTGWENQIEISATIANAGPADARDVQAVLVFDAGYSPGLGQPRRRAGNLLKGEDGTVRWTFRPPTDFRDRTISFTVTVSADNASAATSAQKSIRVVGEIDLAKAGPLFANRERAVILGDSFSSGEGTGSYDAASDNDQNACHRSNQTYVAALDLFPETAVLACSGAISANVRLANDPKNKDTFGGRPTSTLPSQVDQMRRLVADQWNGQPPDIVFLTLGGNDVGFGDIIKWCVILPSCHRIRDDALIDGLNGLPSTLYDAYVAIDATVNQRAWRDLRGGKEAPIVVLGYPEITPSAASISYRCQAGYTILNDSKFSVDELKWMATIPPLLNGQIDRAVRAQRVNGKPFYFASTERSLRGHQICDADPWVNILGADDIASSVSSPLLPIINFFRPGPWEQIAAANQRVVNGSFHPTADGYSAMTSTLVHWSRVDPNAQQLPVTRDLAPDESILEVVPADPGPPIVVSGSGSPTASVQPGEVRTVVVTDLQGGSSIDLHLRSDPMLLGRAIADPDGQATTQIAIPVNIAAGDHTLEVSVHGVWERNADGEWSSEPPELRTVAVAIRPDYPTRWIQAGLVLGALLVVGGLLLRRRGRAGVVERSPRRRRRTREADAVAGTAATEEVAEPPAPPAGADAGWPTTVTGQAQPPPPAPQAPPPAPWHEQGPPAAEPQGDEWW